MRAIVTYDTHHGSAKRLAQTIANRLECLCVNVDTPFRAEDETAYDALVLVFGFRGPYTAQLTKLFVNRMRGKLRYKHLVVVGEGIFSEKEFPSVAEGIREAAEPYSFRRYFMQGELRVDTLTSEEQDLLGEFSRLTGMRITDMGAFDQRKADAIADDIKRELDADTPAADPNAGQKRWICTVCGYVHTGDEPPESCPVCGQPAEKFKEM